MRFLLAAVAVAAALAAGGCSTLGYYVQSARGQLDMMSRAAPIPQVVADPQTSAELKRKLRYVERVREFASRELKLPDNGSYRSYADLKRPYVVWNVFAAPELSTALREWCFPVAGCVTYRGYFSRAEADAYADGLRRQGYDVHIGGVPAYSTLGWFDDPVLNTFIGYPDVEVARLIFHELAHQLVYAKGDSKFNESFATAVELEGLRRWLEVEHDAKQQLAFEQMKSRRRDFVTYILGWRRKLDELYRSGLDDDAKRAEKARLFAQMQAEYPKLKERWGGYKGYDRFFAQPSNNATLASVAVYTQLVPAFQALLDSVDGHLPRFYMQVRELASLSEDGRNARLRALAPPLEELEWAARSSD